MNANSIEVVDSGKVLLTYKDSLPVYDQNNLLKSVDINFEVIAPKTGSYQIDASLLNYNNYEPNSNVSYNSQADSRSVKEIELTENMPTDLNFSFDTKNFTDINYQGNLFLFFMMWRTKISVKDIAWHQGSITALPVKFADSGRSNNFKNYKTGEYYEPGYSIGPFPLHKL